MAWLGAVRHGMENNWMFVDKKQWGSIPQTFNHRGWAWLGGARHGEAWRGEEWHGISSKGEKISFVVGLHIFYFLITILSVRSY